MGEVLPLTIQNKQGELFLCLIVLCTDKVCIVYWTLLLILNTNTNRVVSYALYATLLQATCVLMMHPLLLMHQR